MWILIIAFSVSLTRITRAQSQKISQQIEEKLRSEHPDPKIVVGCFVNLNKNNVLAKQRNLPKPKIAPEQNKPSKPQNLEQTIKAQIPWLPRRPELTKAMII